MDTTRKIDLLVLSDVHLDTYGCQAKPLLKCLKSIDPKKNILNGDIIDIWQFNKRYWPKSHMRVVKYILTQIQKWIENPKVIPEELEQRNYEVVDRILLDYNKSLLNLEQVRA